MSRRRAYERLELTDRFERSYQRLDGTVQEQCDQALEQLLEDPQPPGLRLKPIRPTNVYYEARINRGDRLVLWPVGAVAYVMDVITHDEIAAWGQKKAPVTVPQTRHRGSQSVQKEGRAD